MATNICKESDCSLTVPINYKSSIGDSLSAISFNFRTLDINLCNLENSVNQKLNPIYTIFSEFSSKWNDSVSILESNSSCWIDTYSTVSEMSGFWLKPITIVYPYPFTGDSDITTIQDWLNEYLPPRSGNCVNYIVGQELYVHSPEYLSINRTIDNSTNVGSRTVQFTYTCDCIGRGKFTGRKNQTVDCGSIAIKLNVEDQYINKFVGIKYTVNSNLEWSSGVKIFG